MKVWIVKEYSHESQCDSAEKIIVVCATHKLARNKLAEATKFLEGNPTLVKASEDEVSAISGAWSYEYSISEHEVEEDVENESGLMKFAKSELKRLEDACKDEDGKELQHYMSEGVLRLMSNFCNEGHSNFSASYAINMFRRLADWKPLSAVTGEEGEWRKSFSDDEHILEQNTRYCGLFRNDKDNSKLHDVEATVYSDNGGATWFSSGRLDRDFAEPITLPYYPPTEPKKVYIEWIDPEQTHCVDITFDQKRIKELREKHEKELETRKNMIRKELENGR